MNRRKFLKVCGLAAYGLGLGFGTHGCASFPKNVNWSEVSDKEFSLDKFDDWFVVHKLYNGLNPNLKFKSVGNYPSFKATIFAGVTPGIDYSAGTLYAIAPCYITQLGEIHGTGRPGGNFASFKYINLDPNIPHTQVFYSQYVHLGKIYPKYGKLINRGDPIADIPFEHSKYAKILFINDGSLVDPDNYGENHSYMKYDLSDKEEITNMSERHQKQWKTFMQLLNGSNYDVQLKLTDREHRPIKERKQCNWDYVEKFRYLTELYQARSSFFSDIPKDRFEELKADFYANQPIILTLPVTA